jgi:invasion protein IalB
MTNSVRPVRTTYRNMVTSLVCSLLFGFMMSTQAISDQVQNGEVIGDWRFECVTQSEGSTNCALVQTVIDRGVNEPLLQVSFARSSIHGDVVASVLLPLGVDLMEGVTFESGIDSLLFSFRICLSHGCLARRVLEEEDLRRFANAEELKVGFYAVGDEIPIHISSSSRGLIEAFHRLGFVNGS